MRWALLLPCLLVAGCDSPAFPLIAQARAREREQARAAEAKAAFDQAQINCATTNPLRVGNYASMERCMASAKLGLYVARGLSPDLADISVTQQAVFAGQVDRGEITEDESRARIAQMHSELTDRQMKRRNEAFMASPPPPRPLFVSPSPTPVPSFVPLTPVTTNCNRFGASVNCTTY